MGTACASLVARCARGTLCSSAALCAIQHRVPRMQGDPACLFAAIASQGIGTRHAVAAQRLAGTHWHRCPHPSSQSTTHLSESFPAILVNPGNPSLFDYSTGNPTQSESIHHYYILLHIIKIIFIFNSFTCTGRPDLIDPGRFKFAGRNLVGLPILMPLIDTN